MANPVVQRFDTYDFVLRAPCGGDTPFHVTVQATFTHESGARIRNLPGFYDGDGRWVIRFSPTKIGTWRGVTESPVNELNGIELGPCGCVTGQRSGTMRIDPDHPRRFVRADGEPFVPLGFECDWLFSYHQRDPEACAAALDRLLEHGFNYVVTNVYAHTGFATPEARGDGPIKPECVYGPPDMYVFGGTNEEPDHTALNVDFFRDFDRMMAALRQRDMMVHLMIQVQNKHVRWPRRRSPADDMFWRYVVARYQAFGNVVWDVGKESYNLLRETGSHDYTLDRMVLIRRTDAYHNLVTVHDPAAGSPGRNCVVDRAADFISDQVHLGDTARYNREAVRRQRDLSKPYMNIEYGYEKGAETLKTYTSGTTRDWQDILQWTLAVYLGGAYPCYYYSNTAWDLIAFDPEPPGWARYGFLREFLSLVPFNTMSPDNELVESGFCLADVGRDYLVFLPAGGDPVIDLTALSEDQPSLCRWLEVFSGERHTEALGEGRRFITRLANPLTDTGAPCLLHIEADEVLR